jgi:hypothetical protein
MRDLPFSLLNRSLLYLISYKIAMFPTLLVVLLLVLFNFVFSFLPS